MLQVRNVTKTYALRTLFSGVSFHLGQGERVGLVGRNGQGKTTLFKMIVGEEPYDSGDILCPKLYTIGYLRQHLKLTENRLLQEAILGLPPDEREDHHKAEKILFGLGFSKTDMMKSPQEFSGGYQIRIHLAKVLLARPNLLLLDEPTNYLDILSLRWLVRFLQTWDNELMLISHDRGFMDQVCTHTMGIHRGKVKKLPGGTFKYYEQLVAEETIYEKTRIQEEKKIKEIESFINRFRAKASKAAQVQSRVKALDKRERSEKLEEGPQLDFEFSYAPCPGQVLMRVEDATFSYPQGQPLFSQLSFEVTRKDRIGVIGKNGRGKSTLLKVLAREETLGKGDLYHHPQMKLGYFGQTNIERLTPQITIEEEVQRAVPDLPLGKIRSLCGTMLFSGDDAQKKISVLSGGEKSRVLLTKILATPCNLLLLDEPNNHLDMESVESLVEALDYFPGAVIFVTHNEMLLDRVANKLVVFGGEEEKPYFFHGHYGDFLEKLGWGDEKEEKESSTPSENTRFRKNSKEYKHKKSEWVKERGRKIGPLKEKQGNLENDIISCEEQVQTLQGKIIELSQKGESQEIGISTRALKDLDVKIEKLYESLQDVTDELQSAEDFFQNKLKEFTDE